MLLGGNVITASDIAAKTASAGMAGMAGASNIAAELQAVTAFIEHPLVSPLLQIAQSMMAAQAERYIQDSKPKPTPEPPNPVLYGLGHGQY